VTSSVGSSGSSSRDGRLIGSDRPWIVVLVAGTLAWAVTALVAGVTGVENLVANIVLLGSFLAPVVLVLFALARAGDGELTAEQVILGFLGGGVLGTIFAALTEVYFLPNAVGTFVTVGFFEEIAKTLVLVAVGTQVARRQGRDGMILGATVGAGFAAFESAGYALQTFVEHHGDHAVLDILSTELQRAILSPFGHLTWTALVGGAIFAAWRGARFGPWRPVVWTFVGVVTLHALWDASYGISILVARGFAGDWRLEWPNTEAWIGSPTGSELITFNLTYDLLIGINAVIGTAWVVHRWRRYRAEAAAGDTEPEAPGSQPVPAG
jgi:RsiW-degrading membrane proteinase PrsW (M82 family)